MLSTVRVSSEVRWLPAASVATARSSYGPSGRAAVGRLQARGEPAPVQSAVHEPPGARCSMASAARPEPVSDAVALSATVPLRYAPGSASAADGCVLSTRREAITAEVRW